MAEPGPMVVPTTGLPSPMPGNDKGEAGNADCSASEEDENALPDSQAEVQAAPLGLDTMLAYYAAQRVCSPEAWEAVVASLQKPWLVTARLNSTSLGLRDHTLASLPHALRLPAFPCGDALLLGEAGNLLPDVNKALHSKLILLQKTGELFVQELASMLPALLLEVRPEHCVLDLCAAPGSKSLQLLDRLCAEGSPRGLLVANDVDARRLRRLLERARPLPSCHLLCTCFPAQKFPTLLSTSGSCSSGRLSTWTKPSNREPTGQFKLKFDRVLCDVPCSSDGGVRKGARKPWSAANGLALHVKQLSILLRGFELLAPGGRLVYSTCSLNPLENEAVLAAALKELGGCSGTVEMSDAAELLGASVPSSPGVEFWRVPAPNFAADSGEDGFFDRLADVPPLLRGGKIRGTMFPPTGNDKNAVWIRAQLQRAVRVLPGEQTGGFFLAVLTKQANSLGTKSAKVIEAGALDDLGGCCVEAATEETPENENEEAPPEIGAGSRVTVQATGNPAVVIGPGAGQYEGLVKIRYPDRSTYHLPAGDLELAQPGGAPAAKRDRGGERAKTERKPGSRPLRPLHIDSPNLVALADFLGLHRDAQAAAAAGVDPFPWHGVCFRSRDKLMLHLTSPALLSLRTSASLRPTACGQPLLARCETDADLERWGGHCPLRPCLEAASLLARCASKRVLRLVPHAFAELLRKGHGEGLPIEELKRLQACGEVSGLETCQPQIDRGFVVAVLRQREHDSVDTGVVAVIGILCWHTGLEPVVSSWDVRSRFAEIAEGLSLSRSQN